MNVFCSPRYLINLVICNKFNLLFIFISIHIAWLSMNWMRMVFLIHATIVFLILFHAYLVFSCLFVLSLDFILRRNHNQIYQYVQCSIWENLWFRRVYFSESEFRIWLAQKNGTVKFYSPRNLKIGNWISKQ